MNKGRNSKRQSRWMFLLCVALVVSMLIGAAILKAKISENIKRDAMELTSEYVGAVNAALFRQQQMLQKTADFFSQRGVPSKDEIGGKLQNLGSITDFDNLCYIDGSGSWSTSDEIDIEAVRSSEAYSEARHGTTTISEKALKVSRDVNAIAMYTPVYSDGEVKGVLAGFIYSDSIGRMLAFDVNTQNIFLLVDDNTDVLGINNDSKFKTQGYDFNTFIFRFKYKGRIKAESIKAAMKEGGFSSVRYTYYGDDKYMTYAPFGVSRWYLIKLVPYSDVLAPYSSVIAIFIVMCIAVSVAGVIMVILIRDIDLKITALEKINQRYSFLDTEQNSITYTYNRTSRAVELNGAVEQILGKEFAALDSVNLMTIIERLHPEDQDFIKALRKKIEEGDKQFVKEIRVMNPAGKYGWYKLTGIVIDESPGENGKIVGNVQSTDEEIDREHALRRRAETDLLTGLLNKITMEDSVNSIINERPHGVYYFYIIDLDNFKEVNDNLGHAMGDNVLVEVADKLRQIFSEYDCIGRIGGDEFAVLLNVPEGMNLEKNNLVEVKAKALNNSLRATYSNGDIRVNVSASIGIARYDENSKDYSRLYKHADEILYYSKRRGKDQYNFYEAIDNMKDDIED